MRKHVFLISILIMTSNNLFASTGTEQARIVAAGIIATVLILVVSGYRKVKESGVTTKDGRKQNKIQKEIDIIDKKIVELKIILHQEIITQEDFEKKISDLNDKKRELKIDYYMVRNSRYKSIIDAHNKGYINEEQKAKKIKDLRETIEGNMK